MTLSVLFTVEAEAFAGLLPRLLAPLAKRDLVPDLLRARRSGDQLRVEIGLEALPEEYLHVIEGSFGQVIGVHRVEVTLRAGLRAAA